VIIYNGGVAAGVRAEFSPLERALNYPKSRPAGGGCATFAGAMSGPAPWVGFMDLVFGPDVLVMAE
jgi:hypothetical protein